MKRGWRNWLGMALILAGAFLGTGDIARAQETDGQERTCADYVGLSNRIVMCLRQTVGNAADVFFDKDTGLYPSLRGAVMGFLTLGVIVYGILAMYGMLEKPGRDVMVLMVKLTFITSLVVQVDWMYNTLLGVMDDMGAAVVQFTPNHGSSIDGVDVDRLTCIDNMKRAADIKLEDKYATGPNYNSAWIGLDCIIDSVIGLKIPENYTGGAASDQLKELVQKQKLDKEHTGMSRGLLAFFFSSMQTSVLGIMMAIIGFVFIYSLVWLILKALFVYLAGYIGIAFMMIFAPLFIPLVLFRVTKEYFNKWLKLTLGFTLQPILILAFVSFSIAAIDLVMFSGDYSIMYRIAGEKSRAADFNVNKYMEENQIVTERPAVAAEVKTSSEVPELNPTDPKSFITGLKSSKCAEILTRPDETDPNLQDQLDKMKAACRSSYPVQWWHKSVDWQKMAAIRQPAVEDTGAEEGDQEAGITTAEQRKGRTISREVFAALLLAAVTVLCINGLLSIVPSMVNDLVGESFQSPNLFQEISRRSSGGLGITGNVTSSLNRFFNNGGRR